MCVDCQILFIFLLHLYIFYYYPIFLLLLYQKEGVLSDEGECVVKLCILHSYACVFIC